MFILETIGKDRGYSKQKDMPLINVDLRNNPDELENKIKSIFSISTSKPAEEIEYKIKEEDEDKEKEVEEIDEEDKDNEIDIEVS